MDIDQSPGDTESTTERLYAADADEWLESGKAKPALQALVRDLTLDRDAAIDKLAAAVARAAVAEIALLNLTARVDRDYLRDEDEQFCAGDGWSQLAVSP